MRHSQILASVFLPLCCSCQDSAEIKLTIQDDDFGWFYLMYDSVNIFNDEYHPISNRVWHYPISKKNDSINIVFVTDESKVNENRIKIVNDLLVQPMHGFSPGDTIKGEEMIRIIELYVCSPDYSTYPDYYWTESKVIEILESESKEFIENHIRPTRGMR